MSTATIHRNGQPIQAVTLTSTQVERYGEIAAEAKAIQRDRTIYEALFELGTTAEAETLGLIPADGLPFERAEATDPAPCCGGAHQLRAWIRWRA